MLSIEEQTEETVERLCVELSHAANNYVLSLGGPIEMEEASKKVKKEFAGYHKLVALIGRVEATKIVHDQISILKKNQEAHIVRGL